ncbi:MAG: nitrous oxide reductase family maturation protein NosD [Chitinophagaceae bacterium]|jgi:nitrous oxidase accessory protein|nr:nitrous oxide reductase family maturation protein NosD [Chitinophagaceae bacterium]
MKKYSTILFLLIAIISQAKSIEVGKQKNYITITNAFNACNAGDTIFIHAGTYYEKNLIINKTITLIGINYPILDGEFKYEIISVQSSYVVINGLKIQNSGVSSIVDFAGIKLYNVSNVKVENNIVQNCFFGIYLQNSINCLIQNNRLSASAKEEQQSGNGIHCWKCDSLQIIANKITGHRDGIYFEFVTNSIIWRNNSYKNMRYGLHFMFSNNDTYAVNIFENNGAGVAVMFSNHVKMFGNYFKENWGDASYGILLKEISDSHIQGNRFEENTSGIFLEGASRILMERNVFQNNGWGLKIQASCMDIVLQQNNFIGNTFDVGTNGSLVLNKFNNNYWDKYEGYDLNKDKIGDIPYRPVSMYSMIVEKNPPAMMLFRSFITALMDKTEKVIPSITPENLKDEFPLMKPLPL